MTRAAFFTAVCMMAGVLTVAPDVHAAVPVLSGYVTDAEGAPVEDVLVHAIEANVGNGSSGVWTNADGYYQMSIDPGTYDIQAIKWNNQTRGAFVEDVVVGGPLRLDLTLVDGTEAMTVTGTVPLTGVIDDVVGTVRLRCGNGNASTSYVDVAADGSYSATVDAPAVATCFISLRTAPFGGQVDIQRNVQLVDGSAVVDFVYPDTFGLTVENADGSAAADGSVTISTAGPMVMPDGVTAEVSTIFGGSLEEQPFTVVMLRSAETEFLHHARESVSSEQMIDTTGPGDVVVTLPGVDTFVLTGSVAPLPDEGAAEVTVTCGEDNENDSAVVEGTYEIEMSALVGSWCEIALTARPVGSGSVRVTRPLPTTGATRTADLPYPELVIVTVLTAEGDPVEAGNIELVAAGQQVMPDGATALMYTSDHRELYGETIYTTLRRGQTAWTVTLEDGTQLHGEFDSTASNVIEITLPQLTTYQVTGAVTDPDDTLLHGWVTVTCGDNSASVETDPPGAYSASVVAPVGSTCGAHLQHNRPEGGVSITRDVVLTGDAGVADFRIPPTLALHIVDTRGGPIDARTRLVSAGHATMPDGDVAWAQTELTAAGDVGETAAPLVRSAETYYTIYDDLHQAFFNGVFDTSGVDEVTFDLATGEMTAGGPDVAEVTITGTVTLSDGSPGYGNVTLVCDGQTSGGGVNEDGTYTMSQESSATECTIKVRANGPGSLSISFERTVAVVDEVGEADFQFPAPMTFHFVDPTGDPIVAGASVSSFGNVMMPDGESAYVQSDTTLVPTGLPISATLVRANPMYYNVEDYTHDAEYWGSIDTTDLDEVTFVLSTGVMVGGSPTSSIDGDGVSDAVEAGGPNGGDGNGDGTPDHQQANVTSLPSWNGPYVSIAGPSDTTLVDVSAVDPASYGTPPTGQTLPDGLFAFTIDGVAVGGSTTVRIHTPSAATITGYAKFHDGAWSVLPAANVEIDPGGEWVELTLVDGGVGDDDGVANGSITDPGGVVLIADSTPPVITCATVPTTWSATNVSIACTASDTGSGLAVPGDASFSLSTSVASGQQTANATTGQRSVCDVVGNCATGGPISGIKVDRANPTISVVSPVGTTVPQGTVVVADYSCADGGAGIASCVGSTADGATINTSTAGPRTLTVTATDAVGNVSSQSVTFTVVAVNAAPVVRADLGVAGLNEVGFRTRSVAISGSFTDADGTGPYQVTIRWSPTGAFVPLSSVGTLFAGTTTYSSAGARVVTVRVCDRAGACGTDTLTVRAGVTTKVRPVVQCVTDRGARTSPRYVARLGYDNPASFAIVVPTAPGSENTFTAAPYFRGQPQLFLPGQQRNVFQVGFASGTQRWRLNGTDVSMSSSTRRC